MDWCFYYDKLRFIGTIKKMKKIIFLLPLLTVLIVTLFLLIFLLQEKNSNKPPSALLNKDLPEFKIINLFNNNEFLKSSDIKKKQSIINFFASWCSPCKEEHPLLIKLKNSHKNLLIIGINHKDKKINAIKFINNEGNPYDFVGQDSDGKIGLEFGVFGLPETFLTDRSGKIIFKQLGPLTDTIINNEIIPLLQ